MNVSEIWNYAKIKSKRMFNAVFIIMKNEDNLNV